MSWPRDRALTGAARATWWRTGGCSRPSTWWPTPSKSRCGWVPRPAWDRTAAGTSTSPPRFWTRDRTWRCFRSPRERRAPWSRRCWGGWTAMLPLPCRSLQPGAPGSSCGLARRGESGCASCTRRTARSRPARIRRPAPTRWPTWRLSQTRTRSRTCTRPGRACPVPPCGQTSGSSASWPSTTRAKAVARSPCGPWRSCFADPPTVLLAGGRCSGPRLPNRPGGLWLVRRAAPGEAAIDLAREVATQLLPLELQERDAVLEERDAVLADLDLRLASDERWCWVQGEAFAGKTALLAWLVTHPPPEVRAGLLLSAQHDRR